jgi:hypothetical protein
MNPAGRVRCNMTRLVKLAKDNSNLDQPAFFDRIVLAMTRRSNLRCRFDSGGSGRSHAARLA